MPTLADLRVQFSSSSRSTLLSPEKDEILVADVRSKLSPAQVVEQKLRRALLVRSAATTGMETRPIKTADQIGG